MRMAYTGGGLSGHLHEAPQRFRDLGGTGQRGAVLGGKDHRGGEAGEGEVRGREGVPHEVSPPVDAGADLVEGGTDASDVAVHPLLGDAEPAADVERSEGEDEI